MSAMSASFLGMAFVTPSFFGMTRAASAATYVHVIITFLLPTPALELVILIFAAAGAAAAAAAGQIS